MLFSLENTTYSSISPSALNTITVTQILPYTPWEGFTGWTFKDLPVSRVLFEKSSLFGRQAAFDDTFHKLVNGAHYFVICSLGDSWNTQNNFSEKHADCGLWEDEDSTVVGGLALNPSRRQQPKSSFTRHQNTEPNQYRKSPPKKCNSITTRRETVTAFNDWTEQFIYILYKKKDILQFDIIFHVSLNNLSVHNIKVENINI